MTTPLFMLRCAQLGLAMSDLEHLTMGLIVDMFTEKQNDDEEPEYEAEQEDFDKF